MIHLTVETKNILDLQSSFTESPKCILCDGTCFENDIPAAFFSDRADVVRFIYSLLHCALSKHLLLCVAMYIFCWKWASMLDR